MIAYLLGNLLGSIVLTGLISRVLDKFTFKGQMPIQKALFVALITLTICTVIGSLNMGLINALLSYGVGTVIWLIFDLVRANRSKSQPNLKKR